MRQADRFVPIGEVGKETKDFIVLGSPPPYRQNLKIDVGTLTGIIGMVGSGKDQVRLDFERQRNIVHAAPSREGRLAVVTRTTQFKEENDRGPRQVTYNSRRQELKLAISYPDNETKTPITAAKNLSHRLVRALSTIPTEKYFTNFFEDLDGESVSGRAAELSMHIGRMAMDILAAPIVYWTLSAVSNTPRPLETIGLLALTNMVDAANDLKLAVDLLNGKSLDEKKVWMALTIAENPLRALYPVSLVHELVIPTARILAHNSITSAQLLKASEK